jgi:hypothetical protein
MLEKTRVCFGYGPPSLSHFILLLIIPCVSNVEANYFAIGRQVPLCDI